MVALNAATTGMIHFHCWWRSADPKDSLKLCLLRKKTETRFTADVHIYIYLYIHSIMYIYIYILEAYVYYIIIFLYINIYPDPYPLGGGGGPPGLDHILLSTHFGMSLVLS